MSGQRGMNRDMRGLGIADFADHDHVGILAHERAQRARKCQPDRRLDLRLVDAGDFVFDRILDGQDLADRLVQDRQDGRKRRGLAAAGRPGDDDHAVRQLQKTPQRDFVSRREAEPVDHQQPAILGQDTDDGGLRRAGSA